MSVNDNNKYLIVKPILNKDGCCIAQEVIDSIPSADVAPVRHGHWIEEQDYIVCSECGARFRDEIIYMQENKVGVPHRCLECGAIMDEEENDGTYDGDC